MEIELKNLKVHFYISFSVKKSLFKATYGQQIEMMRNRPPLADCAIAYLLWLRTVPNDYFDWVDVNIHWRSSVLFRKSCPSLNTCMGLKVFFGQKAISQFLHKQKSRSPMKAFDTFDSFLPLFYAIVLLILCFLILFSQLFLFFLILIHLFFPYFLAWTCAK